ncbi:MAG: hypothetical protein LUM44_18675 [Pyrinomonadaceae bacterium]|nr:hypothetical protein [Pyrinomonadaceae bacterium]
MALNIRENIKRIQAQIKKEQNESPDGTSKFAIEIQEKAIAAILGGAADWEPYMKVFATDADGNLDTVALARLRPEPPNSTDREVTKRNKARAYLIGNGNCGAFSVDGPPAGLEFGVGDNLDF